MEAWDRYARLCIQIDINEPLVNTILIGRFEQPVSYEGIQNLYFSCGRLGRKVEACPYTICKGKELVVADEEGLAGRGVPPRDVQVDHCAQSSNAVAEKNETTEVEGPYDPWMVVNRRTNGREGTKAKFSTESNVKATRNVTPQLPPKIPKWRSMSNNGSGSYQSMPHKNYVHGTGDHHKKPDLNWAPISVGSGNKDRCDSLLGSLGSKLLTKGAKAFDSVSGLLPNPNLQAQPHKKPLSSIKNKKAFARSLSQLSQPNSDRTTVEKLPSASSCPLPPSLTSSPICVPAIPIDPNFKFSASSCGVVNHPNDRSEPLLSGDWLAISSPIEAKASNGGGKVGEFSDHNINPVDHGPSIFEGNREVIVGEQSSPCTRDESIYEDMGFDGMVSEEGDGAPPFA